MHHACARNAVGYVPDVVRNARLQAIVEFAEPWDKPHRLITRLEYGT
jgi:hypothetical protein